ncbi:vitamin B6 photo-protection and homoeostasis-domain-containing protein [Pholiota molesta]|nr:vitamin B6 photo-protection and homoeostasis-domain-containing protein [Pholiota molesta]
MVDEQIIEERDNAGRIFRIHINEHGIETSKTTISTQRAGQKGWIYLVDLMTRMFLPVNYPNSVSPDYLRYQILNTLQAFCNSLASLISSRAILQGFGVGDPNASPTQALLLSVLQDVFSRLTTILSAHLVGSSLSPEAKKFRLLADVLNDTAVILDTFSPALNAVPIPGLRVIALCLSAVFKSLCGIAAGGSKASITMHFATPIHGKGDVGDLNAKDSSKETVLALFGMLLGTLIVPYLTTPLTTYSALFILVGLHLAINYLGVRGLVLRSLNRQRLNITWTLYQKSPSPVGPTPAQTAALERIFDSPSTIRDALTGRVLGHCTIGSSFSDILRGRIPLELLHLFREERYVVWFDPSCLRYAEKASDSPTVHGFRRIHVVLKEGYTDDDMITAWLQALEICANSSGDPTVDALRIVRSAYDKVKAQRQEFMTSLDRAQWNIADCAIMTGLPRAVVTAVTAGGAEDRKSR